MARTAVEDEVYETMEPTTGAVVEGNEGESWKMAKGMSFPVPKKFGKMWQKRVEDAAKVYEMEHSLWDDVMRRYRETAVSETLNDTIAKEYKYQLRNATDENLIRINIRTIMRSTYMKNPDLNFSSVSSEDDPLAEVIKAATDFIMNKKTFPGVDLKSRARRWILHGQLTNYGVMRLDFQDKSGSLDEALVELENLEAKLTKSKNIKEINETTASLQALYEAMPLLERRGFRLSNVLPHKVILDTETTSLELSDCGWLAEFYDLDRDYIDAKYYAEEDGVRIRLADGKPVDEEGEADREDVESKVLSIVTSNETDERRRNNAKGKVEVCMVYDKLTRRKYLFRTDDWCYPLWTFEDDLKLSRFFQHFFLAFTEGVDSIIQPGEASYVTGHVDAINKINRKADQIRSSAFGAMIFDSTKVDADDVKKLVQHLNNPNEFKAIPIKGKGLEKDEKLKDLIEAFVPPAFDYPQLFNQQQLRSTVDRNFSISMADRGEQFKTNTTNDAVAAYEQSQNQATSQLIECIEDGLESLGWSFAELFVSKFTKDEVAEMLGPSYAEKFTPMTVSEFNQKYRMQVAAGSIEKPDTEFKKKEAVQAAQALGQFAQAAPATAMRVVLRMFSRVFSIFSVRPDDWKTLQQEGEANLQKGISTNGATAPKPEQPQQQPPVQ